MVHPDPEVALHPFRADEVTVIEEYLSDPTTAGEFSWFGWRDTSHFRRRWELNRLLADDCSMLVVATDATTDGFVSWRRIDVGYGSWHWQLGIALFPASRGRGIGTRAQRMLVNHLFRTTPVHRVEALTDTGNIAEQRALEKVGFRREGTLRGIHFRDGRWRDTVVYGLLREDFHSQVTAAE